MSETIEVHAPTPNPFGARILVQVEALETKTAGGILIPETSVQATLRRGRVLKKGGSVHEDVVDDVAYFREHEGVSMALKVDGHELEVRFLHIDEVLGFDHYDGAIVESTAPDLESVSA